MTDTAIYGLHAVKALLERGVRKTSRLLIKDNRDDARLNVLISLAEQKGIPIDRVSLKALEQRFPDQTHQGVVALAAPLATFHEKDLPDLLSKINRPALILILDGVTDPHNLGACLRTAAALGVDFVMIPKDKTADLTPTVMKVASGAVETVPIVRVTNLVRAIDRLKEAGVWVYGAAVEAKETIHSLDGSTSVAMVMGSEGFGLRRLTRDHCDGLFVLPMQGEMDSLNVSVATGIALYEIGRQRSSSSSLRGA